MHSENKSFIFFERWFLLLWQNGDKVKGDRDIVTHSNILPLKTHTTTCMYNINNLLAKHIIYLVLEVIETKCWWKLSFPHIHLHQKMAFHVYVKSPIFCIFNRGFANFMWIKLVSCVTHNIKMLLLILHVKMAAVTVGIVYLSFGNLIFDIWLKLACTLLYWNRHIITE